MQGDFWRTTNKPPITLYQNYKEKYDHLKTLGILKDIIMFVSSSETLTGSTLQEQSFKKINWQKDYYSMLQQQIQSSTNNPGILKNFRSRSKTKHTMMLLLY